MCKKLKSNPDKTFSLSKATIYKNLGASVSYKWQNSYYWQSFLINGTVPAFSTVDAQVSYTLQKQPVQIKTGANNLFNHYYYSILGGPQIGGFYYVTVSYGIK